MNDGHHPKNTILTAIPPSKPKMTSNGVQSFDMSIVTNPNDMKSVPLLLKELVTDCEALSIGGGEDARKSLVIKARTLVQSLETPRETMAKHCWAQTGAMAGLAFGVDVGLWKLMAANGDGPQKVDKLASDLGVNSQLLGRLMCHLGAMGYVIETGPDEFRTTNYSKAMSLDIIGDGYLGLLSCTSAAPLKFHEYARKHGFVNPTDAQDTALMYACNTKLNMFEYQRELGYGRHFNHHMAGYRLGRLPWMDPKFFPVGERLIAGANADPSAPFLVDIGGSIGHDLEEFHSYHPNAPGKLILQDQPAVINDIQNLNPAITPMIHDFHAEQPVKGARAYYMHSCLHDWPDDVCESILASIHAAMKPGYSKLLIHENVLPMEKVYWEASALDVVMMTLFSSRERTEVDWHNLLEKRAGFRIVKIWYGGKGCESILECELP